MSGIRITRTGVVHADSLPDDDDNVTLCGKGADYIAATDEAVTCKSCLKRKALAREVAEQTLMADHAGITVKPITVTEFMTDESLITGHDTVAHNVLGGNDYVDNLINMLDGMIKNADALVMDLAENDDDRCATCGDEMGHADNCAADADSPFMSRDPGARELLAEIEAWQAGIADNGDGLFLPARYSMETLMDLWSAGLVVPGSRTAHGYAFGWYSVPMIDADHGVALIINAFIGALKPTRLPRKVKKSLRSQRGRHNR